MDLTSLKSITSVDFPEMTEHFKCHIKWPLLFLSPALLVEAEKIASDKKNYVILLKTELLVESMFRVLPNGVR